MVYERRGGARLSGNGGFGRRVGAGLCALLVSACAYSPTKEDMARYHQAKRQTAEYLALTGALPRTALQPWAPVVTVFVAERGGRLIPERVFNRSAVEIEAAGLTGKCVYLGYGKPEVRNDPFISPCRGKQRPESWPARQDDIDRLELSLLEQLFDNYRNDLQTVEALLASNHRVDEGLAVVGRYPGHDFVPTLRTALRNTIDSGQTSAADRIFQALAARNALTEADRHAYGRSKAGGNTYADAITAYRNTRAVDSLARAGQLAATDAQKAEVEFELLQLVKDKAVAIAVQAHGLTSASAYDHSGFFGAHMGASMTTRFVYKVALDERVIQIKFPYKLRARIHFRVTGIQEGKRNCGLLLMSRCKFENETQTIDHPQTIEVALAPGVQSVEGSYDLRWEPQFVKSDLSGQRTAFQSRSFQIEVTDVVLVR